MRHVLPPIDSPISALAGVLYIVITMTGIFGLPFLVWAAIRFFWQRTVYVRPHPELWAMFREWQATAQHEKQAPQTEPPAYVEAPAHPQRPVHLSMFGR